MASFNSVVLLGNCTRDIEMKYTQGGTAVCDIGLAVNERVKKNDQWVDEPCFVDCTCFGRTAEIAGEFIEKGSPVLVSGRLKYEQWEADGQKRSKLKVLVDRLQLITTRSGGEREQPQQQPRQQSQRRSAGASNRQSAPPPPEDDVPF